MSQTGYVGSRRRPGVMVAIVGGHVAVLAAVMLTRMDMPIPFIDEPTVVVPIPLDQPPPPVPPPPADPTPAREPQAVSEITTVVPIVPRPMPGPIIAPPPTLPPTDYIAPPGRETILAPPAPPIALPPAPIPDPPAPRAKPVALSPRGNPSSWVTNDDYPSSALTAEEQGRTRFVVLADASGRATECTVTGSSGSSALDRAACKLLMQRARFKPGTDADGAPVGGSWASSFRWQIPED